MFDRRFVRLAAASIALAGVLYGQPKPRDPKPQDISGWDKIRWGMTIAEARSAYGIVSKAESNSDWTLLTLNPVKIGDIKLSVQVGAKPPGEKITLVRLWLYFGLPTAPSSAGPQDFDTLRIMLIQKYGQPSSEETKRGENFRLMKSVLWTFPSTSILLALEQSASLPNLGSIYLDYSATSQ
jgi:hypothetical protein